MSFKTMFIAFGLLSAASLCVADLCPPPALIINHGNHQWSYGDWQTVQVIGNPSGNQYRFAKAIAEPVNDQEQTEILCAYTSGNNNYFILSDHQLYQVLGNHWLVHFYAICQPTSDKSVEYCPFMTFS